MATNLLAEAQRLISEGHLTDAELAFARAIETGPSPEALIKYADFLLKARRLSEASSTYEEVVQFPGSDTGEFKAPALRRLGEIALNKGDTLRSEKMFRRALRADKAANRLENQAEDYRGLGRVLLTRSEFNPARDVFERALELDRDLGSEDGLWQDYVLLGEAYARQN